MSGPLPLAGLRVLEFSHTIMGPCAGLLLADMGAEGKTWTPEELDAFLAAPRDYAKGTKMSFAGLRKETERADVIAYLSTFTE